MIEIWSKYFYELFVRENTNEKLLKNIEKYEQKEREVRLGVLNEINQIDKRMKRFKNDEDKLSQLLSRRDMLRSKLKTKK